MTGGAQDGARWHPTPTARHGVVNVCVRERRDMTDLRQPIRAEGRLWYVLDLNPLPWTPGEVAYASGKDAKRKVYMRPSKDLKVYQEAIRDEMAKWFTIPLATEVDVVFVFIRSLDEIYRGGVRKSRAHKADATNMQKATEDALQGILFDNDNQNRVVKSIILDQGPDLEPYVAVGVRVVKDGDLRALVPQLVLDEFVEGL